MTNPPTRNILKNLFTSFIQSFRIRQLKGNFMGEDYFGNKYYEIPADPKTGKRKTSRWFEPPEKENFEQEVTAEWEAWLRNRRKEPPTREELIKNLQIMEMKKLNAAELDKIYKKPADSELLQQEQKGKESFPTYKDYEVMPGQKNRPQ